MENIKSLHDIVFCLDFFTTFIYYFSFAITKWDVHLNKQFHTDTICGVKWLGTLYTLAIYTVCEFVHFDADSLVMMSFTNES